MWIENHTKKGERLMTMKKVQVSIILSLLFLFCGCASRMSTNTIAGVNKKSQNEFLEKKGTEVADEWELQSMITYDVDKTFSSFKVWAEVYQDGKLIRTTYSDEEYKKLEKEGESGVVAIYLSEDRKRVIFEIDADSRGQRFNLNTEQLFEEANVNFFTFTGLKEDETKNVKENEKYLIAAIQFDNADEPSEDAILPSLDTITKYPEDLKRIPYILLIKCEFVH